MLEMDLAGSPYQIGYQHGRLAADLVRRFHRCVLVDKARQGFRGRPQGTPEDFRQRVRRVEHNLRAWRRDYLEELRGIADGAAMDYDDILDLNFSTEGWGELLRGCTTVVVTTDEGPLLGKTEDVDAGDDAFLIVQRIRPVDGLAHVKISLAGTLWTSVGLNEAGLTYSGSGLPLLPGVSNWDGLPPMVVNREMLFRCQTVADALAWQASVDYIKHGAAYCLADAAGEVAVVEKVPTRQAVRAPVDGVAFTVNDAWCPEVKPLVGGNGRLIDESHQRADNLLRLAHALPRTVEGMQTLLRDHAEAGGICHHGQVNLHTASAAVVAPRQRKLWATQGYPCLNPFLPYSL
jgi:isopenicillin-N N-acyltransferase-like protein